MTPSSPSRYLPLPGTTNFRDLGGYIGHQGRPVRWRMLFRSDHLAGLTPEGVQELAALGVQRSADFRGVQERTLDAYALPGVTTHALTVEPTVVQKALALVHSGGRLSVPDTVALMQETYRHFVRDNAAQFARLFELLLAEQTPTVFHCTAGKDRTGMAAALLLGALDVDRDTVMEDYLLTNQRYRRDAAWEGQGPEHVMAILWQVQEAFLNSAFETIDHHFGGLDAYLEGPVGLHRMQREALRQRLLA